ncbi:hypothetical protein SASPL_127966 [Salvia splendens]|uniref:Uncharacterized protein n=1 Tax=Salvia splendens TaxID=180675 RepID=A0A8X8XBT9_SALSN|nr:hypothetical protein SASPL_127966 [Salvia splendens]
MDPKNPNPDEGSMSAGGVSIDTPKTVLDERRDPLDDFTSEPFPPDTDSARLSLGTISATDPIPAMDPIPKDNVSMMSTAVAFVRHVHESGSFRGECSSELCDLFAKKVVDYAYQLLLKEGPSIGIYPPPPGGDDAGSERSLKRKFYE